MALLTSESLALTTAFTPDFPYVTVLSVESGMFLPRAASTHTVLFTVLTLLLLVSAVTSIFPIRRASVRLLYAVLFGTCVSRVLLGWAFQGSPAVSESGATWISNESIYCTIAALTSTFAALHRSNTARTSYGAWAVFALALFTPVVGLGYVYVALGGYSKVVEVLPSIAWVAAVTHSGIGITIRVTDVLRDVEVLRSLKNGVIDLSAGGLGSLGQENQTAGRICVATATLAVLWTIVGTAVTPLSTSLFVNKDTLVPLSTLVFLGTHRDAIVRGKHPAMIVALLMAAWWTGSALYSVLGPPGPEPLVKGLNPFLAPGSGFASFFQDASVSLWTSTSPLMPALHIFLTLLPQPAIIMSFLGNRVTEVRLFLFTLHFVVSSH